MTFTVWLNKQIIGDTEFELEPPESPRLAGVFRPTDFGLTVLPAITCLFPALLELHAALRQRGIVFDSDDVELDDADLDLLTSTPAGLRVLDAARHISNVVLRDATGRILRWKSLMISDFDELADCISRLGDDEEVPDVPEPAHRIRYLISATMKPERRRRRPWTSRSLPPPRRA